MRVVTKLIIGNQYLQTYESKGKNPYWNQALVFENIKIQDKIKIEIYDK